MELTCIAIDDEPLALKKLGSFIEKIPGIKLIETFSNCIDAVPTITGSGIDIVFLDIQMDHMTGIDLLEKLEVKPHVVIISAFEQYALKGYELNVSDYILKPYGIDRLIKAIEKIKNLKIANNHSPAISGEGYIFVKSDYRIIKLNLKNIMFVEGMRDYLCFHTSKGKVLSSITFVQLQELLPETSFIRVHKSFTVNLNSIDSIEKHRIYIDKHIIPISKSYRNRFYNKLRVQGKIFRA